MEYWGRHYLADCKSCDIDSIKNANNIKNFVNALVNKIDMIAYGEPILEHFATHDPLKGGYTLCQMISTSLIDGHFVDSNGDAYISVHSCKNFNEKDVRLVIEEYFNPVSIKETIINRMA